MIERKFVEEKIKEHQIQEFILGNIKGAGHSSTKLMKTPLGEKIVISASRPGLVVGKKGANIKQLTKTLKKKFGLENPQIEINEVEHINLDANIIAEKIADSLEKFGTSKFKGIGHKVMSDVMGSGALGIEILISGKIPSSRAKNWRFYQGYLKKCGDTALTGIRKAYAKARLKTGVVGIKVSIMPPDVRLPDNIRSVEELKEKEKEQEKKEPAKEDKEPKKEDKPEKPEKPEKSEEGKDEDKGNKSDE